MASFQIKSVKINVAFEGTLDAAIERAKAIDAEYQPSFGVQVESKGGETLWDSSDDERDLLDQVSDAVESSGVCCPEQVVDAVYAIAQAGGDWKAELAKAVANDASERKALGIDE